MNLIEDNIIDGGFLQSNDWKRFQAALGRDVELIESEDGRALMLKYTLPIVGSYFFVPRGPILGISNLSEATEAGSKKLMEQMISTAKKYRAGWIRIEPQSDQDWQMINKLLVQKHKIVKAKKDHEPAQTLMLDLTLSEEQLLSQMKQKTRYNIRLAEKRGVEIYSSNKSEDVETFCDLVAETARRDKVVAHPRSYYCQMLESIPVEKLKLYLAKYQGQVIAGALVSFSGQVATYQHGASSNEQRNVMAPYLLQWTAINEAKQKGMKRYDFGGASLAGNGKEVKKHWQGITRFKLGFCSEKNCVNFPGCYDIIIDAKKYWLYRLLQGMKDLRNFKLG